MHFTNLPKDKVIADKKLYDKCLQQYGQKFCDEHLILKNSEKPKEYQHIKSNYYEIGNQRIYFKSKWEANYALYLEYLKKTTGDPVEWYYEKDTFVFEKIKFGTRSFKIDFTVVRKNRTTEYHEVKGYWDKKSLTKVKRMKIYYPDKKLVIIGKEEYKALQKYSRLLGFY